MNNEQRDVEVDLDSDMTVAELKEKVSKRFVD